MLSHTRRDGPSVGLVPLSFPATKSILWDHTSTGPAVVIHMTYYRDINLIISSKALQLARRYAADSSKMEFLCLLQGSLSVDTDGGITANLERFDMGKMEQGSLSPTSKMAGDITVPLIVMKSGGKPQLSSDDYFKALQMLQHTVTSGCKIQLDQYVVAFASLVPKPSTRNGEVYDMGISVVSLSNHLKATPVKNVPIVPTALSKNLAGPASLSDVQGEPKAGYLTMDHTRKLLLILESDPKVYTLPLVGIWLSGIPLVYHPFVWAACLRYLHNAHIQERVCKPPEPFLLVLYSPLHSQPEFYEVTAVDGGSRLTFQLYSAVQNIDLSKTGSSEAVVDMDLCKVQGGGQKMEVFQAAVQQLTETRCETPKTKDHVIVTVEDSTPRATPSPHTAKTTSIQPSVPDVSLIFDDDYQPGKQPHTQGKENLYQPTKTLQQQYTDQLTAFRPKKQQQKPVPSRQPLKPVNRQSPSLPVSPNIPQHIKPLPPRSHSLPDVSQLLDDSGQHDYHQSPHMQRQSSSEQLMYEQQLQPSSGPGIQQSLPPYPYSHQYPGVPDTGGMDYGVPGKYASTRGPAPRQRGPRTKKGMPGPHLQPSQRSHSGERQRMPRQGHQVHPHHNSSQLPPQYAFPPYQEHVPHWPAVPPGYQPGPPPYHHTGSGRHSLGSSAPPPQHAPTRHQGVPQTRRLSEPIASGMICQYQSHGYMEPYGVSQAGQNGREGENLGKGPEPQRHVPRKMQQNNLVCQCQECQQSCSLRDEPVPASAVITVHHNAQKSVPQHVHFAPPEDHRLKEKLRPNKCACCGLAVCEKGNNENKRDHDVKSKDDCVTHQNQTPYQNMAPDDMYQLLLKQDAEIKQQNSQLKMLQAQIQKILSAQQNTQTNMEPDVDHSPGPNVGGSPDSQGYVSMETSVTSPAEKMTCSMGTNTSLWLANGIQIPEKCHTDLSQSRMTQQEGGEKQRLELETDPVNVTEENQAGNSNQSLASLGSVHVPVQERTDQSFVSDMVVDIPSYESSPERTPKNERSRPNTRCDQSFQSPVLGESISMYEQGADARVKGKGEEMETERKEVPAVAENAQYYENIIKNVKQLLAKHSDSETPVYHQEDDPSSMCLEQREVLPDKVVEVVKQAAVFDGEPETDVVCATIEHLKKLGINETEAEEEERVDASMLNLALLPKVNYMSLMLDDLPDTDASMEMNALAMKYLSDDQLSQFAKLSTKPSARRGNKKDTLLHRVLLNDQGSTPNVTLFGMSPCNMTMATRKYMERYGLIKGKTTKDTFAHESDRHVTSKLQWKSPVADEPENDIRPNKISNCDKDIGGLAKLQGQKASVENRATAKKDFENESENPLSEPDHEYENGNFKRTVDKKSEIQVLEGLPRPGTRSKEQKDMQSSHEQDKAGASSQGVTVGAFLGQMKRAAMRHSPSSVNRLEAQGEANDSDSYTSVASDSSSEGSVSFAKPTLSPGQNILDIHRLKQLPKLM